MELQKDSQEEVEHPGWRHKYSRDMEPYPGPETMVWDWSGPGAKLLSRYFGWEGGMGCNDRSGGSVRCEGQIRSLHLRGSRMDELSDLRVNRA